ncbi:hypothetical protein L3X38_019238 [Prunus dulcis]|uniref:Uncharacterized protein n=1 Tax=Prunus dulcis TaxID=3755 RepID=A0AAD4WC86_PRUDU|nr:hypothetical protein L3X38_019238 [Prunus dulcis]
MSKTPTILPLIADSKKYAVNPADPATLTHTSIATTKGSTFHKSSQKSAWIIDSSATDHMTFDPSQLISCKSSPLSAVSNANGTSSPVVGDGSLSLSTSLHLDSVLLVPSLDHNLLSIVQLTTTLGCTVTFWLNHCVFQDILTGKTIGCGTRWGKLYYLNWAPDNEVKKGYRCYHPPSQKVFTSIDVVFREHDLYFSTAQEENRESTTALILDFFPQDVILHQNDRLLVESNRSPPLSSSTTENLLQNDWSPKKNDQLSPRCQNQEEELNRFMRFCPFQLQYCTNHLLMKSLR